MPNIRFWKRNKIQERDETVEDQKGGQDEENYLNDEVINIQRKVYNYQKFKREHKPNDFIGFSLILLFKTLFIRHCSPGKNCIKKNLYNRIPAIKWLKKYKLKDYFLSDLLAGLTVGIMHIPQGMGYALLANVPPIYGLYTSFFPVLIYWIFGTSRQISMGTFAVVSLMVGSTLNDLESKYVPPADFNRTLYEMNINNNISQSINPANFLNENREKAKVLIVMAHAFWVGIIQIIMFTFQLGFLTSYLSEPLVNSFITGSAIHVFTSQMKSIFGVTLTSYSGILKIPKTYIELFSKIPQFHVPTLIIAIICITILLTIKIHVNERFQNKMPVPFPTELLIVIFGTLISYLSKLHDKYHVKTIGPIPPGIPGPQIPPIFIIKDMLLQSFLTAIVSFAINFSLCDLFSKKHRYKINTSQELLAYGASNVFSSFFPCFASGGSLARSCVQDNAGGKTQLVSIVSCMIVGFVLAFIAPLFRELPLACLSSIIVVALKTLLLKLVELKFYWKVNKIEFAQFLITFLSVVILDVDIGLGIGVLFYVLSHIVRSSQPYSTLLGHISGTEFYKDINLYKDAYEIDKIKIVRIQSELHATNSAFFKKSIYELTGIKPQEYIAIKNKIKAYEKKLEDLNKPSKLLNYLPEFLKDFLTAKTKKNKIATKSDLFYVKDFNKNNFDSKREMPDSNNTNNNKLNNLDENYWTEYEMCEHEADKQNADTESQIGVRIEDDNDYKAKEKSSDLSSDDEFDTNKKRPKFPKLPIDFLIIDCSPINFIDTVGVKTIKQLISDYNEIGIKVYLADCNDSFRDRFICMEKAKPIKERVKYLEENLIHLSIHDAVTHALKLIKIQYNSNIRF